MSPGSPVRLARADQRGRRPFENVAAWRRWRRRQVQEVRCTGIVLPSWRPASPSAPASLTGAVVTDDRWPWRTRAPPARTAAAAFQPTAAQSDPVPAIGSAVASESVRRSPGWTVAQGRGPEQRRAPANDGVAGDVPDDVGVGSNEVRREVAHAGAASRTLPPKLENEARWSFWSIAAMASTWGQLPGASGLGIADAYHRRRCRPPRRSRLRAARRTRSPTEAWRNRRRPRPRLYADDLRAIVRRPETPPEWPSQSRNRCPQALCRS